MMDMQELKERMAKQEKELKMIKTDLLSFITDKKVPLEERWNFFVSVSKQFKEHSDYLVNFSTIKKYVRNFNWNDSFEQWNRGHIVQTEDIIIAIEEMQYPECEDKLSKAFNTIERINELQEEILVRNIGSFVFDW